MTVRHWLVTSGLRSLAFRSLSAAVFCCVSLAGARAGADPRPSVRLDVERARDASECVDAALLAASVETRLGRRVFTAQAADLRMKVRLERSGAAWRARIELADALGVLGERELTTEARHCSALDDSLALVVALLADTPPERPRAAPRAHPAESAAPVVALNAATALRLPRDTYAPRQPWTPNVRLLAVALGGLVPGVSFGSELSFGLTSGAGFTARGLSDAYLPKRATIANDRSGAKVSGERLGLDLCAPELGRGVRASFCLGERLGLLHVSGFGFDHDSSFHRFSFALSLGAQGYFGLARNFDLVLALRAELPLTRERLFARTADGVNRLVFQTGPLGLLGQAGFEVKL